MRHRSQGDVFVSDVIRVRNEDTDKYQPLFRIWFGHLPEVSVMKPEHVEVRFSAGKHNLPLPLYVSLPLRTRPARRMRTSVDIPAVSSGNTTRTQLRMSETLKCQLPYS